MAKKPTGTSQEPPEEESPMDRQHRMREERLTREREEEILEARLETEKQKRQMKKIFAGVIAFGAFLLAMTVVFGSWYTVDQTEVGVVLRNGAATDTAAPGLHFKTPMVESVVKLKTTQQVAYWTCTPPTAEHPTPQACQDNERFEMQAYSYDQQPAYMRVTISWHMSATEALKVYSEYGSLNGVENKLIARLAPQEIKTVFGKYNAQTVIQDRAKFNVDVTNAIMAKLAGNIVTIDSVQVENIDFSGPYVQSIEAAMKARVAIQQRDSNRQEEEVSAKITVIKAQALADSQLAAATAQAKATQLQGEAIANAAFARAQADAKGIELVGQATAASLQAKANAIRDNPQLLDLTRSEKWNGALPTMMTPNSTVPFLNLNQGK